MSLLDFYEKGNLGALIILENTRDALDHMFVAHNVIKCTAVIVVFCKFVKIAKIVEAYAQRIDGCGFFDKTPSKVRV